MGILGEIFDETVGVFVLNMKIQGKHYGHFGGNFFGGTLGNFLGKLWFNFWTPLENLPGPLEDFFGSFT